MYRCIGVVLLCQNNTLGLLISRATVKKRDVARALMRACQENGMTKTVAAVTRAWKSVEKEGRIYVVRGLSQPSRGIVYTESQATCSRRFMKSFVRLVCACVGECTRRRGQRARLYRHVCMTIRGADNIAPETEETTQKPAGWRIVALRRSKHLPRVLSAMVPFSGISKTVPLCFSALSRR